MRAPKKSLHLDLVDIAVVCAESQNSRFQHCKAANSDEDNIYGGVQSLFFVSVVRSSGASNWLHQDVRSYGRYPLPKSVQIGVARVGFNR